MMMMMLMMAMMMTMMGSFDMNVVCVVVHCASRPGIYVESMTMIMMIHVLCSVACALETMT
jgi:hypothetical protein